MSSDGSKLTIDSVTKDHEGIYTCRASNAGGIETIPLQLNVTECRSRFSMGTVPPCLVTVILADESQTMVDVNRRLSGVCLELEQHLQDAGIGTGKRSNQYAVVGFGSNMKARIVSVKSRKLFTVDKVALALRSLRRDADRPDGFHAITHALKHLPLRQRGVGNCALHLLISTHEPRTVDHQISREQLNTQLCMREPLVMTAILPGGFAVGPYKRAGLGVDSTLSAYISVKDGIVKVPDEVKLLPKAYSVCQSFKDYGDLALRHHGSVWDAYRLMLSSSDTIKPLSKALANVTVTKIVTQFRPCKDCACKRTADGTVVYECRMAKDPYYCRCRSEGNEVRNVQSIVQVHKGITVGCSLAFIIQERECKALMSRACKDGHVTLSDSTSTDPAVLLPSECR